MHCCAQGTGKHRRIPKPSKNVSLSEHDWHDKEPYRHLDRGENEISEYCLHKAKGDDWDECMVVWDDVHQQRAENTALLDDPERAEEVRNGSCALHAQI